MASFKVAKSKSRMSIMLSWSSRETMSSREVCLIWYCVAQSDRVRVEEVKNGLGGSKSKAGLGKMYLNCSQCMSIAFSSRDGQK